MTSTSWIKRHSPCQIDTRRVGEWTILEVSGKFTVGPPELLFMDAIDRALATETTGIVVDLTGATLADEAIATAARTAHHRARLAGAELKMVVPPGKAGGYYHMAGLELIIPTFSHIGGAIEL